MYSVMVDLKQNGWPDVETTIEFFRSWMKDLITNNVLDP